MKICIIGAGGMGSLYGGLLARSGAKVVLVDPWVDHIEAIQRNGLRLDGIPGDLCIKLPATMQPDGIEAMDVAIIQADSNATAAAAQTARQMLKDEGFAITLQNGAGNVEALCEALGRDRVLGGLSHHSATLRGPGHVSHTHSGPTWLGELDGSHSARLEALRDRLAAAGLRPIVVDDIMGHIWNKVALNCAINPICAVTGLRIGEIPRSPDADALQTRIIKETLAVIAAKGIRLPDPDPMATIKQFCRGRFNKPSMLQHVEAGRRTEIDSLNAVIVREGRTLGVPTPYNEALSWMLRALEGHMRQVRHGPPVDYDKLEAMDRTAVRASG